MLPLPTFVQNPVYGEVLKGFGKPVLPTVFHPAPSVNSPKGFVPANIFVMFATFEVSQLDKFRRVKALALLNMLDIVVADEVFHPDKSRL